MTYRVLHLIPFPIKKAQHGGQIRARETNRALENAGFEVIQIQVFDAAAYAPHVPDIDVSETLQNGNWTLDWRLRDYSIGAVLAESDKEFSKLVSLLPSRIDLLIVEEPWLGAAALRLKREGHLDAPIMFNSYNVEHLAKKSILLEADLENAAGHLARITALEKAIVTEADRSSAVTKEDAALYSQWSNAEVVVAPNGTTNRKKSHLHNIRHQAVEANARYALFVGSAHPPNIAGFRELITGSIASLRPLERIVVAGSVCDPLHQLIAESNLTYMFRDKVCLLGRVSDFGLDCLLENASIILLPITYGGGSNLKTAEALVSGKPIVATEKAFRGYEDYLDAPGVKIANNQRDFASAIRTSFDMNDHGNIVRSDTHKLLWEHTLRPITDAAAELVAKLGETGTSLKRKVY